MASGILSRGLQSRRQRRLRRVSVVGGSIGELTVALLLRDAGWDATVFERSLTLLEGRGGGIVVHPATIRYLVERTGAAPADISVAASRFRYLDAAGSVGHEEACRYRFTSYDAIYRRLLACFDQGHYRLGQESIGVDDLEGRPRLTFASGDAFRSNLVIFADGINSVGRRLLAPYARPVYAGYVAWRGTVAEGTLAPWVFEALSTAITYHVLSDGHVIVYPIPGEPCRRLINWLWYRNVLSGQELDDLLADGDGDRFTTSVPPGRVPEASIAAVLREAKARLPRVLAELIEQTPQPFLQMIFDVEVERMAFGRVCLIGDAAFTVRPHIAAGTAKAAEDAWTLAQALGGAGFDVGDALAGWSQKQVVLGAAAVMRSREAGNRLQNGRWRVGEPLPYGLYRVGDSALAPN